MSIILKLWIQCICHCAVSQTAFNIHSPFVWDFYNQLLRKRFVVTKQALIERQREAYLLDKAEITHFDKGAGASTSNQKPLRISSIAKTSLKSPKQATFLYKLANYYHCRNIIELGTSLGISSMYLALASTTSSVYSLEASPEILQKAKSAAAKCNISNIQFIEGNFDQTLAPLLQNISTFDMAFIDGNHTYEATLRYFHLMKKHVNNQSMIIFDDIYWSKGMLQAWNEIVKDEEISLSFDLYFMGILFFRKENKKQHFSFRI